VAGGYAINRFERLAGYLSEYLYWENLGTFSKDVLSVFSPLKSPSPDEQTEKGKTIIGANCMANRTNIAMKPYSTSPEALPERR
jgi:hypothetical protein